jgi:zinc D-Ala-D-Ala carboxypeptidase
MLSKKTLSLIALSGLFFAVALVFAESRFSENNFGTSDTVKVDVKAAAQQNSNLKNNLKWTFGSKMQTGWYLYVPLIQHLIKTEATPESEEFALALTKWQQKSQLETNGVLDEKTIVKMVGFWQSRRLNRSDYPVENELLTAPIDNFYDPTRGVELLKVKKEAYSAYKQMVAAAIADKLIKPNDDKFLKIISAFRSREYQEKLRLQSPNSTRTTLAQNSPHFTGCALDIYVGGEPVSTKDTNRAIQVETHVYKWLVKNAEKFGFYPYYYEPWHWEYAPKTSR